MTAWIPVLCLCRDVLDYSFRGQHQSDAFHAVHNNDPALLDDFTGGILGYNFEDGYGYTLLMRASQDGALKNVVFLLDRGADRTVRGWDGRTAYDLAYKGLRECQARRNHKIPFYSNGKWTVEESQRAAQKEDEYRKILTLLKP